MDHTTELLIYFVALFVLPFLGIVAGAHYERWLKRRRRPRVMDSDWRGF